MVTLLLLYCYATGTRSSRKIIAPPLPHRRTLPGSLLVRTFPTSVPISNSSTDVHLARVEGLFVDILRLWALTELAPVAALLVCDPDQDRSQHLEAQGDEL